MSGHIPVMLEEVIKALDVQDGDVIIDGTFGGGGYTRAFLEKADCKVIAVDRDETAIARAVDLAAETSGRVVPARGTFSKLDELAKSKEFDTVNGVVLDIGVSSFQIDEAERGFSFMKAGPLDMRMDQSAGQTAADLVNKVCDEKELADLFYKYGEERNSRKIARAIVNRRDEEPFETTKDLAGFIAQIQPKSFKDKQHPATRCFQALRIAVNDELGELERGLEAAERILAEDGRLVVVTFHSLEDGIVKSFLKDRSGNKAGGSRYMPEVTPQSAPSFKLVERKAVIVSQAEADENPRARSAKLRWAVRTDAPAQEEVAA